MFRFFGRMVVWGWPLWLVGWIALLLAMRHFAPPWDEVAESGQFSFLPNDAPSIRAMDLFKAAFPNELAGSNVVIVLSRDDERSIYEDKDFIEHDLRQGLIQIADREKGRIARIRTLNDEGSGALLVNGYQNATLVLVDLTSEFLERSTWPVVNAIEKLIEDLRREDKIPEGLQVALSGSAVVGRDMRRGELQSANAIELWTVWIVIGLLLIIYRAPLLALIPLVTVFFAVQVAVGLVSLMAKHELIALSETNRIYINVLSYGAGVDYCLFLIARYREELGRSRNLRDALANAIGNVGHTVTASAATVICGIAVLTFARFGKYHQAGITIPLSLAIVLVAALTFSTSLLRLTGRWVFWPQSAAKAMTAPATWEKIGRALQRRPAIIWLATIFCMSPFAVVAVQNYNFLDYGLTKDLPPGAPSLEGIHALDEHFPAGLTGTITLLVRNNSIDFTTTKGSRYIRELVARLEDRKKDLEIDDIRSVAQPLGISAAAKDLTSRLERLQNPDLIRKTRKQTLTYYVSDAGHFARHVTRIDIVSKLDPLSRSSIENLRKLEQVVQTQLPPQLQDSELNFIGSMASLRDLQDVTTSDMRRIEVAVPIVVFVILIILLREFVSSLYLIATVIFSYLATLGVTFAVFWLLDPAGFSGLDWKVPIFLFTILVAVGEDYNIFLMTRVHEEREAHGPIQGVTEAVVKTGGIISSCGFIMAGTFASLLSGSLIEMKQLGFALSFGVLVDTLVVRPLLVPAFLVLIRKNWLSRSPKVPEAKTAAAHSTYLGQVQD
jgi:putative drug exporter of the RND superfamily